MGQGAPLIRNLKHATCGPHVPDLVAIKCYWLLSGLVYRQRPHSTRLAVLPSSGRLAPVAIIKLTTVECDSASTQQKDKPSRYCDFLYLRAILPAHGIFWVTTEPEPQSTVRRYQCLSETGCRADTGRT